MSDLAGNDVGWRIRQEMGLTTGSAEGRVNGATSLPRHSSCLGDKLCEHGFFGQKTGRGWYKYDPKSPRKGVEDVDTLAFLQQHRQQEVALFCHVDTHYYSVLLII